MENTIVIDDDEEIRKLIKDSLQNENYEENKQTILKIY